MIRSLSPYYIETPFVSPASGLTCTSYTMEIFIWDGAKLSPPAAAEYTFTKNNFASSSGTDKVNIARLISDYIDFTPQSDTTTNYIDGNNTRWVKTQVTYATTLASDGTTPQLKSTSLFSAGYSYGDEGENNTLVLNNMLMTGTDFKVNRTGVFSIPVLVDEVLDRSVTVISYPSNEINESFTIPATTFSSKLVQNIWVKVSQAVSDTYIEVIHNAHITTILIQDECMYTPLDIFFQNKDGGQQSITFFKEKTDSLNITDETFESDRGQPSEGNHQFVRFNVQGRSKFKMWSGFVPEETNETFKQLFLSERHWIYNNGFIPINIGSKELSYKTQLNEKLIQYEVEFEYSYNEINNI